MWKIFLMNRRVDQKLHLAKLIVAAIDTNPPSKKNPAIETALVESALFHLHIAYRAYLHELLLHCKVLVSVETAQQAADLLQSQHLQNGDIDELAKLEQSGAWPTQLRMAYADATSSDVMSEAASNIGIALHDVTACIDSEVLGGWLQQFQMLLDRQREHAQEW